MHSRISHRATSPSPRSEPEIRYDEVRSHASDPYLYPVVPSAVRTQGAAPARGSARTRAADLLRCAAGIQPAQVTPGSAAECRAARATTT